MLTDNMGILAYVFGIPLFLILVAVIMSWIKSIRSEEKIRWEGDYGYNRRGEIVASITRTESGEIAKATRY